MRLKERTLRTLYIAPGLSQTDAMGAEIRVFSRERVPVRASLIPANGTLGRRENGMILEKRCLALMPLDAPLAPGDGVAEAAVGEPEWLCTDVRAWSAHLAATLERRIWP